MDYTFENFFRGTLSQAELSNMDATMDKLVKLWENWQVAGCPADGQVASDYFYEVLRHVNRFLVHKFGSFNNADDLISTIRDEILLNIKDYIPARGYTPLNFAKTIINHEQREYHRFNNQETVYYNQMRTKINAALRLAGYPQGLQTPGLDAVKIHTITQQPMNTVATVMAIVSFGENIGSLDDFKERGVKETEYLTDNAIGKDPYTKFEEKEQSERILAAKKELTVLERFVVEAMNEEALTQTQVLKLILKNRVMFDDDINKHCERSRKSSDRFDGNDVSIINSKALEKLRTSLLIKENGNQPVDILEYEVEDCKLTTQSDDDDFAEFFMIA